MDKTETRAGYSARLVSPYINTTGKCLEMFYWIREELPNDALTTLTIIAISEEHTEDVLNTISDLTPHFPRLHLRLPDGIRDLVRSRGLGDVYKRQIFTLRALRS